MDERGRVVYKEGMVETGKHRPKEEENKKKEKPFRTFLEFSNVFYRWMSQQSKSLSKAVAGGSGDCVSLLRIIGRVCV